MNQLDSQKQRGWSWILVPLIVAGALLAAWVARPMRRVGWGQTVQYDDFAYEVVGVNVRELGSKPFTVVTFKVHNRAKRVSYRFRHDIVVIKDAGGELYAVSPPGQRALDATDGGGDPCGGDLRPGASCTTRLAFDLPADISEPRLQIRHGGWIGAIIDSVLYGDQEIVLDAAVE